MMQSAIRKPKLVFFQYKYDERLPPFLLIHKQEHVNCLSVSFDVTVVQHDCDYEQICDTFHPDVALFESGVNHETCERIEITNVHARPEIPKLGLHHADAFCNARAGFLSDMDRWGIETFFAISTTAAEHTPEIADNLFVWPVFVDVEVYRDYGAWKSIPVLMTGNTDAFYPWRQRIFKLVSERYPSLICPHSGYAPGSGFAHILVGERYARTINASWCVPTCGTIAKEVVRKHFEVPACKACLITERSAALEAAGFVDMQNCVFADEHDALDKLDWLFDNPDQLNLIINAGHQLVNSRHTLKHRDQIFQWFNLHKTIVPGQRIIQLNPFDSPILVTESSGLKSCHVVSNGLHLALLREGDRKLWEAKYEEAEGFYLRCMNHMRWMPEPRLRLALCSLYKGDARSSLKWLQEPIQFVLAQYKAADPDPVEWAYLIVSLLCMGKLDIANKRANQFPRLSHSELDRARWVSNLLKSKACATPLIEDSSRNRRPSIHRLPDRSTREWIEQFCIMLRACGQGDRVNILREAISQGSKRAQGGAAEAGSTKEIVNVWAREERISEDIFFLKKRLFVQKLKLTCRASGSDFLHRMEAKYGFFLPYQWSLMRHDEFFKTILHLTREENIETALVVGATSGEGGTEALLAGVKQNQRRPLVFCLSHSRRIFSRAKRAIGSGSRLNWYGLSSSASRDRAQELDNAITGIMKDNQIRFFDAVLINGSAFKDQLRGSCFPMKVLQRARLVLLQDINHLYNYNIYSALLRDSTYDLVAANPSLRDGYAIFRKVSAPRVRGKGSCAKFSPLSPEQVLGSPFRGASEDRESKVKAPSDNELDQLGLVAPRKNLLRLPAVWAMGNL